jgi:hypothetical protein
MESQSSLNFFTFNGGMFSAAGSSKEAAPKATASVGRGLSAANKSIAGTPVQTKPATSDRNGAALMQFIIAQQLAQLAPSTANANSDSNSGATEDAAAAAEEPITAIEEPSTLFLLGTGLLGLALLKRRHSSTPFGRSPDFPR